MAKGISEICGQALLSNGRCVNVYRALRPLVCAACGSLIKEKELFSRGKLAGLPLAPRCRECLPFELQPESATSESGLLKSLFETSSKSRSRALTEAEQRNIRRKVEKRLGPALKRTARRKA